MPWMVLSLYEDDSIPGSIASLDKELFDQDSVKDNLKEEENKKATRIVRDAMGEYVPGDGEPLTQLAIPLPGPADYSPTQGLTKPSAPQYSIVGKPKPITVNDFPGPNKYYTEGDMVWKDSGFPMIGKGKAQEYPTCTYGPAAYKLEYGNLGSQNPKWTMRELAEIPQGPPHILVQPVDSHGFKTPGPAEYRPKSSLWRKNILKSFGLRLKKDLPESTPGPAEYDIRKDDRGPKYSLAKRLPIHLNNNNPGPGAYDIGTTIGNAVAKSLTSRQQHPQLGMSPSPNTYNVPTQLGKSPKYSMTYRSFERKASPKPSPASYKPTLENLQKCPKYTCRRLCKPIYPDILNYAEYSLMKSNIVGPGTYVSHNEFSKNDAPAYSMGKRIKESKDETPGPASYFIKQPARPDAKRAAAFSMGIRIKTKSETVGPGPAAYYPNPHSSAPKYSMSSRNKKKIVVATPAPNMYRVLSAQTNCGIQKGPNPTLKGRPSPFVYSGFRKMLAG